MEEITVSISIIDALDFYSDNVQNSRMFKEQIVLYFDNN